MNVARELMNRFKKELNDYSDDAFDKESAIEALRDAIDYLMFYKEIEEDGK